MLGTNYERVTELKNNVEKVAVKDLQHKDYFYLDENQLTIYRVIQIEAMTDNGIKPIKKAYYCLTSGVIENETFEAFIENHFQEVYRLKNIKVID